MRKIKKSYKNFGRRRSRKTQEILKNLDEEYYNVVHKENPRRLLRAI